MAQSNKNGGSGIASSVRRDAWKQKTGLNKQNQELNRKNEIMSEQESNMASVSNSNKNPSEFSLRFIEEYVKVKKEGV